MFRAFRYQALAMPLTLEQAAQNCLSYLDFICSTLVDERTSRARRARKRYRYPRFRHPRRRSRDRPPARLRARRPQGEAARRLDSGASARADRPHRLHRHPPVRRLADGQARHRRRSLASPSARATRTRASWKGTAAPRATTAPPPTSTPPEPPPPPRAATPRSNGRRWGTRSRSERGSGSSIRTPRSKGLGKLKPAETMRNDAQATLPHRRRAGRSRPAREQAAYAAQRDASDVTNLLRDGPRLTFRGPVCLGGSGNQGRLKRLPRSERIFGPARWASTLKYPSRRSAIRTSSMFSKSGASS